MNILTIPFRNARRKWARTLLLLAVFSLGVASITALLHVSEMVGDSLEKKLTAFGANILVYPKADTVNVSYGGFSLGDMLVDVKYLDEQETAAKIRSIKNSSNVAAVAPKLVAMREIDGVPIGVVGVRFADELGIKGYWAVNGAYPQAKEDVLLGSSVANRLGLEQGDTVPALGPDAVVSGVLHPTGSDDDNVILADLGFVQEMTGQPGAVSFVEVAALCSGCPIEEITSQIQKALPGVAVSAVKSVVKQRMYSVNFVKQLVLAVSVVILLTACSMVGLSMLSSVSERKREIGVLRSLGYSRGNVFGIFCFEAVAIGVIAGIVGYAGGGLIADKVARTLDMIEGGGAVFDPARLALTCGLVVLLCVVSAAYPAFKASRVEPAEALISL